jgi:hypothetical protein
MEDDEGGEELFLEEAAEELQGDAAAEVYNKHKHSTSTESRQVSCVARRRRGRAPRARATPRSRAGILCVAPRCAVGRTAPRAHAVV